MICLSCLEIWIDEALEHVRQTTPVGRAAKDIADLYEHASAVMEGWDVRRLIPSRPHRCEGAIILQGRRHECRCRCRERAACRT